MTRLVKRSLRLTGHRTSVALEAEFWQALEAVAVAEGRSLADLVSAADTARAADQSLASWLRLLALRSLRAPR